MVCVSSKSSKECEPAGPHWRHHTHYIQELLFILHLSQGTRFQTDVIFLFQVIFFLKVSVFIHYTKTRFLEWCVRSKHSWPELRKGKRREGKVREWEGVQVWPQPQLTFPPLTCVKLTDLDGCSGNTWRDPNSILQYSFVLEKKYWFPSK